MQSRTSFYIVVILTVLASVVFAQEAVTTPEKSVTMTSDSNEAGIQSFPYVAEVTGDNVNIRSGAGVNYYSCGKLNKGDRIKVVNHQFNWSCIVPPAGSFSWISIQYVSVDASNPTIGTVTGNSVRVWVGSDRLRPIYSTTSRLKLNKGEKVKLMGEEKDKYYKIVPPAGAYRWVSTKHTKVIGEVGQVPPPVVGTPAVDSKVIVPTKLPVKAGKLEEYYALEKQIRAEQAKPISRQKYTKIKQALLKIAGDKEAGKAARYSEFAIKQIMRYELAGDVAEAVRRQDDKLQQDRQRIKTASAARIADVQDLGRFAAIGQFQISSVYGLEAEPIHYRITDGSEKTICYALPTGAASTMHLSKLVGRKVGLVGTIEPHTPTKGALVRFAEIVELK